MPWRGMRWLVFALVALACSEPARAGEEHPSRERLVHPVPASETLRLTAAAPLIADDGLLAVGRAGIGPPYFTIGALDAPAEQVFGAIESVGVGPDGTVLILDVQAREVRIFDERGRALRTVGGYGGGPGEFLEPRSMRVGREMYVAEASGHVSVFRFGADSVAFSHFLHHGGDIWDLCVMRGHVYVHGMTPGDPGTVHVYGLDSELLHSFGEVYRTGNPMIRHQLSRGRIACAEAADVVLLAPAMLPELRAYSRAGELLWWMEIEDFVPLPVTETATGGSLMTFPERGWHTTIGLAASDVSGAALLQVALITDESRRRKDRYARLHTFMISLDDRAGSYVEDGWPRVLHWEDGRLFAVRERPYPELVAFEIGRGVRAGGAPGLPGS